MPRLKNEIENLEVKDGVLLYLNKKGVTLAAIEFEEGEEYPYTVYNYKCKGTKWFITGYNNLAGAIDDILKINKRK